MTHRENAWAFGLPPEDMNDLPTADDPFGDYPPSAAVRSMERRRPGPPYEDPDANPLGSPLLAGGSIDPNDQERSTTMNENSIERTNDDPVDGYSDAEGEPDVDPADPGFEGDQPPMSPEEYAEAQKQARDETDER